MAIMIVTKHVFRARVEEIFGNRKKENFVLVGKTKPVSHHLPQILSYPRFGGSLSSVYFRLYIHAWVPLQSRQKRATRTDCRGLKTDDYLARHALTSNESFIRKLPSNTKRKISSFYNLCLKSKKSSLGKSSKLDTAFWWIIKLHTW